MIRGISNCDVNFMYNMPVEHKQQQQQQSQYIQNRAVNNEKPSKSKKIAATVAFAGAIIAIGGSVAYLLKTGKKNIIKPTESKNNDGIINKIFKFADGSTKKITSKGYHLSGKYVKDGYERFTRIVKNDESTTTILDYLTPAKQIHFRAITRDNDLTLYYFARKNGKAIGYAKKDVKQNGQVLDSKTQVTMYDGYKVETDCIKNLYEKIPAFNPEKMDAIV